MLNLDDDEAQSTDDFKEELWQISIDNNFELINSYAADVELFVLLIKETINQLPTVYNDWRQFFAEPHKAYTM